MTVVVCARGDAQHAAAIITLYTLPRPRSQRRYAVATIRLSTPRARAGMASTSAMSIASTGTVAAASPSALPLYAPPASMRVEGISNGHQERRPFDQQDPRVYFDQQSQTWKCEAAEEERDGDASELEWDAQRRLWMPVLDEDLLRAQQAAYGDEAEGEEDDAHDDGDAGQDSATSTRKRKARRGRRDQGQDAAQDASRPPKQPRKKLNTNVYVTGLPLDATRDEIAAVFSRYGVLYEDDAGVPRVKMYADRKTGMFKGEALITYFKEESVDLAMRVLDESALRAAEGKSDPIMHVSRAEFGSGDKAAAAAAEGAEIDQGKHNQLIVEARGQAESSHSAQQAAKPSAADRKKAQRRFARMNDKLTDWNSDSDDEATDIAAARGQGSAAAANSSKLRQVCLRKMFSLAELDDDPTLLLDLKEDVREECEGLGKVTNVVLWDKEPEGIITVKFGDHASAVACMQKMDGRFFGGRQIIAHLLEGKPRFRRSGKGDEDSNEEDDDGEERDADGNQATDTTTGILGAGRKAEAQRRDAFGEWLEGGGDT